MWMNKTVQENKKKKKKVFQQLQLFQQVNNNIR